MVRSNRFLKLSVGVVAAVGIGALAACTPLSGGDGVNSDSAFAGKTLNITAYAGAWGDAFTEAFVKPFEDGTGATVNLVAGTSSEWMTKLRASQGSSAPFDLVLLTADIVPNAIASRLVAELDTSKLENFGDLNKVLLAQSNSGGVQYGIPLTVGSTGLAYRSDKLVEPVTDWSDVFRPELCGAVAVPPPTINVGIEFLAGLVNEDGGDIADPDDLDAVFTKLERLSECASAFPADGNAVGVALEQGDAAISPWWDGRAFVLQNQGAPVKFTYPESGAVGALTNYFVAENTKNDDLAMEFLRYLTDGEHQKVFAERTWYAASNDTIKYSEEFDAQIAHGSDVYESYVWVDYSVIGPKITEMQDRWSRIFS